MTQTIGPFLAFLTWLQIGFVFAAHAGAAGAPGANPRMLGAAKGNALWQAIAGADVIYIGETHDNPADHAYELYVLQGMIKRRISFAIGWEMFDKTQQASLDAWDRGAISLKELFRETGFDKSWIIYSSVYAKILETAHRHKVRKLALNAPATLARKVARGESLCKRERALLPRGFAASEVAYRHFVTMMGRHPGLAPNNLRTFFAAQSLWDQTMAERIIKFSGFRSGARLLVLTGRGHVAGGFGIPFYVRQKSLLRQLILFP